MGCGHDREIYAKSMCGVCYNKDYTKKQIARTANKPIVRKPLKKVSAKGKKVIDEDTAVYEKLWAKRPHRCEECGKWLGDTWSRHNFSHIISKGAYIQLRHDERNFNILCLEHHNQWEYGKRDLMKIRVKNEGVINQLKLEVNDK